MNVIQETVQMFDDELLHAFIKRYYGYGNFNAKYWFVGMEEGGGSEFAEIWTRINIWRERGSRELEDVAEYHNAIGITHLFNERPRLQPTWNKLIRVLLNAEGLKADAESVTR